MTMFLMVGLVASCMALAGFVALVVGDSSDDRDEHEGF